jgi:hypothetical protein
MARERLGHSDYKRVIELSNPSLPDYGIDESYQLSDQRHWTLKCPHCGAWTALDQEFPKKLGQEVRIILPRKDGTGYYRACPKCQGELDLDQGEWIADYPGRPIHGYRISQLFSSKVDPGEILQEYRLTRYPDRFYQLKIGIPWADLERRLDVGTVLSRCSDSVMLDAAEPRTWGHAMGIDTGLALHVVILKPEYAKDQLETYKAHRLVHLAVCHEFSELDGLMKRFNIQRCVIDGLPETHATREFAKRFRGQVFLNFFVEGQRGAIHWDRDTLTVNVNRTEALDASRAAVREKKLILPRQTPIVEEFARHMAADAKVLDEDEETGAKKYRYIKTGTDHFSLAFTYAWMAAERERGPRVTVVKLSPPARPFPGSSPFGRGLSLRQVFGRRSPFR